MYLTTLIYLNANIMYLTTLIYLNANIMYLTTLMLPKKMLTNNKTFLGLF